MENGNSKQEATEATEIFVIACLRVTTGYFLCLLRFLLLKMAVLRVLCVSVVKFS
jgi:hypothetical protein